MQSECKDLRARYPQRERESDRGHQLTYSALVDVVENGVDPLGVNGPEVM